MGKRKDERQTRTKTQTHTNKENVLHHHSSNLLTAVSQSASNPPRVLFETLVKTRRKRERKREFSHVSMFISFRLYIHIFYRSFLLYLWTAEQ